MSKFTEIFKAKATQITITAVSASLVVGASAGVAIHNNNKRLESAFNELTNTTITESVTESPSETTTESTTESTTKTTTITAEPAGDRTIQYLAEYERITNEYEKKRAELETATAAGYSPIYKHLDGYFFRTDEEYEKYSKEVSEHNSSLDQEVSEYYSSFENDKKEKIKRLDEQYEKDIEDLNRKYGIS